MASRAPIPDVADEFLRLMDMDAVSPDGRPVIGSIIGEQSSPALFKGPQADMLRSSNNPMGPVMTSLRRLRGLQPGAERRVARKNLLAEAADALMQEGGPGTSGGRVQSPDYKKQVKGAFGKLGKARGVAPLALIALISSMMMGED